jgi:Di-sulfide bridge nucleocytoplasmic transport domain
MDIDNWSSESLKQLTLSPLVKADQKRPPAETDDEPPLPAKLSIPTAPMTIHQPSRLRHYAVLPYIISGYVQLLFSIIVAGFWLYLLRTFSLAIFSDIDMKVKLFSEEILEQIAGCSRNYRENRCDPSTRVPAAAAACLAWEQCMARNPEIVAQHTRMTAETIGETLNAFFDTLTWKSIVCIVLLSCGLVLAFNVSASISKEKGKNVYQKISIEDNTDN